MCVWGGGGGGGGVMKINGNRCGYACLDACEEFAVAGVGVGG